MIRVRRRHFFFCRRSADKLPPSEHSRHVARHESAFSPDWSPVFEGTRPSRNSRYDTRWAVGQRRASPLTEMQALMEAAPHEEPEAPLADTLDLKERLAKAVDSLPTRERWVFEAHHYRGLSFRQIARELNVSKTTADRVYRDAKQMLQERLSGL